MLKPRSVRYNRCEIHNVHVTELRFDSLRQLDNLANLTGMEGSGRSPEVGFREGTKDCGETRKCRQESNSMAQCRGW